MKVITLAKTKELLGITGSDQDTLINAKIPYIDSLVKRITRNRYNLKIYGNVTTGSPYMAVSSIFTYDGTEYVYERQSRQFISGINNYCYYDDLSEFLEIGQQIEGTGIPADTYIDEVYYNGNPFNDGTDDFAIPTIKLSANATETTESGIAYLGINIAYQPVIAKGIQYLINTTSTTLPTNALASRSLGPSSKSFAAEDQKMDNKYGMPAWFTKAFPRYVGGH